MKIFASLDIITRPPPGQTLVGRRVANADFLEALLRYGRFDAYHFYPGDPYDASQFEAGQRPYWEALGIASRISLFSRLELPARLEHTDYHVFHQSDFITYFADLCELRSRCARVRFPVTAPIHSISYASYLDAYLRMLLTGPESYDAIICTSQAGRAAVEEAFRQVGEDPLLRPLELTPRMRREVIPLGVDLERFRPADAEARAAARRALELPDDAVVVLCFGRFSEADKYDLVPLLRAFREAIRGGNTTERALLQRAVLVLAGARQGSNYPERLERLAEVLGMKQQVRLEVNVEAVRQKHLYQAADLFVSPSDNLQETFGLTVLEAMATGLPVVASDWDGYKDLVLHEVTGLRIPTYVGDCDPLLGQLGRVSYQRLWHLAMAQATVVDVPALTEALRRLLLSPEQRRAFGEAGRRQAESFAWPEVIARYEALWDALKAEARQDSRPAPAPSMYARGPFGRFPAHPTRALSDDDAVILTEQGKALLLSPDRRGWYEEIDPLIDTTVIRHLCSLARRGCRLGDAVALVADAQYQPPDRVRYQAAWLLKQHLLRLIEPAPATGT